MAYGKKENQITEKYEPATLKFVEGVEGPSIYLNDRRIAGNKPWGGGHIKHTFTLQECDIKYIVDTLMPFLTKQL